MDQEVKDARARLAARFGKATQLGGKGTYTSLLNAISWPWQRWVRFFPLILTGIIHYIQQNWHAASFLFCIGTQRRAKKHVSTQN